MLRFLWNFCFFDETFFFGKTFFGGGGKTFLGGNAFFLFDKIFIWRTWFGETSFLVLKLSECEYLSVDI